MPLVATFNRVDPGLFKSRDPRLKMWSLLYWELCWGGGGGHSLGPSTRPGSSQGLKANIKEGFSTLSGLKQGSGLENRKAPFHQRTKEFPLHPLQFWGFLNLEPTSVD